jgi:hypothetical protein
VTQSLKYFDAVEDALAEEGGSDEAAGLSRLMKEEGGQAGQLYAELKDYFCLVQLEAGGGVGAKQELRREIPLESMARVCRGLGFFPTEREIEDMVNEVSLNKNSITRNTVTCNLEMTSMGLRITIKVVFVCIILCKQLLLFFNYFRPRVKALLWLCIDKKNKFS